MQSIAGLTHWKNNLAKHLNLNCDAWGQITFGVVELPPLIWTKRILYMENQNKAQTDIEKLSVLLPHWLHHNNHHIQDQEQWIKKSQDAGLIEVADELRRALDHYQKANQHIAQADLYLKNKTG